MRISDWSSDVCSSDLVKPALAAIDLWSAGEPESPWTVADAVRLAAVRADRAAAAERYFASQAERWDAIRPLFNSADEVEDAIAPAMSGRDIGRLGAVGTGPGRIVERFVPRATHRRG